MCRAGKQDDSRLEPVLHPSILSYSGLLLGFDERSREHLNFLLVIVSAGIGSLLAGLRTAGFTTLRDLALGLGAGYAVYLLLRGGHFAFFATAATLDVLSRVLRMTLLAPDIVEAVLEGKLSKLTLTTLMQPFPIEWARQRSLL